MIRFLTFLLGKQYETCKSCETLKEQLAFERDEKKRLTDTLLNIINPKALEQPVVELQPIINSGGLFSRRRAALEAQSRESARIIAEKKHIGVPDNMKNNDKSISKLEKELGIETGLEEQSEKEGA